MLNMIVRMDTACGTPLAAPMLIANVAIPCSAPYSAEDGAATSPTRIQMLFPTQPGKLAATAVTRNVPAMMQPAPYRK